MEMEFIKEIASIIEAHKIDDIHRALRVIALQKTDSISEAESRKKQTLIIAQAFLNHHANLPENWSASFNCYADLSDWFETAEQITNHKSLCILSWCAYFETHIPQQMNARRLIVLAKAFYGDPYQFMGFLLFLLNRNVCADDIVAKGVLHYFFSYHAFEISVIQEAYQAFSSLSDATSEMVNKLSNIHCNERGLVNAAHYKRRFRLSARRESRFSFRTHLENMERQYGYVINPRRYARKRLLPTKPKQIGYFSTNLVGSFMYHKDKMPTVQVDYEEILLPEIIPNDTSAIFFKLFGWDFLKLISSEGQDMSRILNEILATPELRQCLQSEFPQHALSGSILRDLVNLLLRELSSISQAELSSFVLKEPFYVHVIRYSHSRKLLSSDEIKNAILSMNADTRFETLHHIPYLVDLLFNPVVLDKHPVMDLILRILHDYERIMSTDILVSLNRARAYIEPYVKERLDEFHNELKLSFCDFVENRSDYDAVQSQWGGCLSWVNLFRGYYPMIINHHDYPTTVYKMRTQLIVTYFDHCVEMNSGIDLEIIFNKISDDQTVIVRTCQEMLVDNLTSVRLADLIIQYMAGKMPVADFLNQRFGNHLSIIYYVYTRPKPLLRDCINKYFPQTDALVFSLIESAVSHKKVEDLIYLLRILSLTPSIIVSAITSIFNFLCNNTFRIMISANSIFSHFELLEELTSLISRCNSVLLPTELVVAIFNKAQDFRFPSLAHAILCLKDDNQLPREVFERGVERAVSYQSYDFLTIYFGLSASDAINTQLVKRFDVLGYVERVSDHSFREDALLWRHEETEDTLLHIAANHCSYEDFKRCVEIIQNRIPHHFEALIMRRNAQGSPVSCYTDNTEREEINNYIAEIKAQYDATQSNIISLLFNVRRHGREEINDGYQEGRRASSESTVDSEDSDFDFQL